MVAKIAWLLAAMGLLVAGCGGDDDGGSSGGGGGSTGGTGGQAGTAGSSGDSGSGGSSGTGGTAAGGTGGATGTPCEQRCAATDPLACPNDGSCVASCQDAVDYAPWCSEIWTTFVECAASQPESNWTCDAQGFSTLLSGVCQTEFEGALSCLTEGPPGGMPDLSADCAATCTAMAGLPCAPANCEQSCNDAIANGPCAGAAGLVTVCGAGLSAGDYECVNDTPVPSGGMCSDQVNLLLACLQAQ